MDEEHLDTTNICNNNMDVFQLLFCGQINVETTNEHL